MFPLAPWRLSRSVSLPFNSVQQATRARQSSFFGASRGNRTLVFWLEASGSTIELLRPIWSHGPELNWFCLITSEASPHGAVASFLAVLRGIDPPIPVRQTGVIPFHHRTVAGRQGAAPCTRDLESQDRGCRTTYRFSQHEKTPPRLAPERGEVPVQRRIMS